MADESKSLWLVPTYRSYKNDDMILTAAMIRNVNDKKSLKKNKKIRRESRRIRKSQKILFTDFPNSSVFQKNFKTMKSHIFPPPNVNEHNLIINSGSNNRVKKSYSDTIHSTHFYATTNLYSNLSWKVYRCQLSSQDESCCCSCNSDAMFEVMKSLYDCYKKKNCDNCNCILCGHLPREERRLGELRKSDEKLTVVKKETLSKKMLKSKKTISAIDYKEKGSKEKEQIFKEIALAGKPLPEAKTKSEKDLIRKLRTQLGLPQEPVTSVDKKKMSEAYKAGLIIPLEGKTVAEKEKILKKQAAIAIPLPEGRTQSEKALIAKVKETMLKDKSEGLLTPIEGKSIQEKERILKGLAKRGLPLPEPKTASDQKLMDRIRTEVGLPPEPKTASAKEKYDRAMAAGLITPLEGKSTARKENILRDQAKMGLLLPEGRTPSEKALIEKVKETTLPEKEVRMPSEKIRKAKAEGLLTPLEGKSNKEKERILKGLAKQGLPLPEAKTASDKRLMDKIRNEVGLPPEPKTASAKEKYDTAMAAGLITPLEGKSTAKKEKILRDQAKMGLLLPEGRTPSEKALIEKVQETTPEKEVRMPSEKIRKAKLEGLLTPLEGKSKQEKEKILKGLAKHGLPFPEAKTRSEQKLIDKVRKEVGLLSQPRTSSAKVKYDRAMAAGLITPLEGKSIAKKEQILRDQAKLGLLLPEGRTHSEKALIEKIKATSPYLIRRPALTPEKIKKLDTETAKVMKEKKGPSDECICDLLTPESEKQPVGIGLIKIPTKKDTPLKVPSEKLRKAYVDGLLTPLEGKTKKEQERILRGLVKHGIPLPEAKTASDNKLMDKIRTEVGLPPEPKTPSAKAKYESAMAAGIISPLDGKSMGKKEKNLRDLAKMGLKLPEGRTPSEKSLIAKVKATTQPEMEMRVPSEKIHKAKAEGLLSPLKGKSKQEKQRILKGLAKQGLPLPEPKTKSDQKLMDEIRKELGLPPAPKTLSAKVKYNKAMAAGIITPLEGKSMSKKEKILKEQAKLGLPLPEGKTPSEKALIAKVKESTRPEREMHVPLEKINKAKAEGLLTPLQGKSKQEKERILRGLAKNGLPLPEAKTGSEQKLIDKVRNEVGLPSQPKTPSAKAKYDRAMAAGLITPLEDKTIGKKEQILRDQAKIGLQLPEGRTPSEKALIAKVKDISGLDKEVRAPLEKMRKAKAEGLLTPLVGKSKKEKERIIKGLAKHSLPLPEAKTVSDQKLIDKIRNEFGLPPEPRTPSAKSKYHKALTAGLITPLEGKPISKKEKILRDQAKMGLELPEGRTPSEKSLIAKIKTTTQPKMEMRVPSERIRKAKAEGLLSPLEGKSKQEKQRILKGLAKQGLPLPEPKTKSDQKLMDEIRNEVGLPPAPKTLSAKAKYNRAMAAGIITPLEGKSMSKKEQILRDQAKMGLPLPQGRSPSEKALIDKVKATSPYLTGRPALTPEKIKKLQTKTAKVLKEKKGPSDECICDLLTPETEKQPVGIGFIKFPTKKDTSIKVPSEKIHKAKAEGLLTPLEDKSRNQKEKILKGLAKQGIPFPEAKTVSDRKLMNKIRTEIGLPPEPKTPSAKAKYDSAIAAGLITPLEGKSVGKKKQIIRNQAKMGLPLPEGRTTSEKALIAKVKKTTKKEVSLTPSEIPILPETASEKEILGKAKAAGILTPLKGKSLAQKEKILKGLADAGLPMPEGATPSEKVLVQKVRAMAGLPSENTPSEKKGKIKQRSKKTGVGGIIEEFEDITKTATCDRGCGCDKKKIRFKHSYVKIRVTSPDISSLCPCPEECVPGVKGGVFTDNEGIKVTIGRATGVPVFSSREFRELKRKIMIRPSDTTGCASSVNNRNNDSSRYYYTSNMASKTKNLKSCSYVSSPLVKSYENFHKDDNIRMIKSCSSYYEKPQLLRNEATEKFYSSQVSNSTSLETIYLLKSDSCSSLTTASEMYSVISFSVTGTSSYSDYNIRQDYLNIDYEQIIKSNENRTVHCSSDSALSIMNVFSTRTYCTSKILAINSPNQYEQEILIFKCIHSESSQPEYLRNQRRQRFLMNFKDINSNSEILDNVSEVLSKISLDDSSTLIVILPSSSNESAAYNKDHNSDVLDSYYLVVKESENLTKRNHTHDVRGIGRNKGIKLVTNAKKMKDVPSIEVNKKGWCATGNTLYEKQDKTYCPTSQIIEQKQRFFSTDTTEDRPCCCSPTDGSGVRGSPTKEQKSNNVVSELAKSMISKEAVARDNTSCSACERSKFDDTSCKETKSLNKGKSFCPCSFEYQMDPSQDTNDTWMRKSNVSNEKKKNKRNKNLKCECAQEVMQLLPEFQFAEEDWIDDAQVRKINSDLTQTVSGFKFNVLRKKPQTEMSFEEILKFYADSYEQKYKNLNYVNNGKLQTETKAAAGCECPPAIDCVCPAEQQDTSASRAEEPLQGIKFHIGGKGSGSKGLTGILCF